jgi:hypothetical protein
MGVDDGPRITGSAHRGGSGVLNPLDASPPGSVWWRAVNERLLHDGCETIALLAGLDGEPSSQTVRLWLEFATRPTGRNWYRAHNATIVAGYLEHRSLAEAEGAPERFFMNVALARAWDSRAAEAAGASCQSVTISVVTDTPRATTSPTGERDSAR